LEGQKVQELSRISDNRPHECPMNTTTSETLVQNVWYLKHTLTLGKRFVSGLFILGQIFHSN